MKTSSKKLIFSTMLLATANLYANVKYSDLSSPAMFTEITKKMHLSSQEIVERVAPIIKNHLKRRNYNRLYLADKFIDFYNKNKSSYVSAIEAFVDFDTRKYDTEEGNGVCFALTNDLFDSLPSSICAYKIGAILPGRYQQNGWNLFPHAAIAIPFESPSDTSDRGYILLDPNFDISFPIVLKHKSQPVVIDMGAKGNWKLHLRENKIMCYIFPAKENNQESLDMVYDTMVYILKEYKNPEDAALKTMIAADRGIPIVSRDENGDHKAHMKVDLRKKVVSSSIYEKRQPLISFEDFSSGAKEFDVNFANLLNMDAKSLNNSVRKIINNVYLLETLSKEYFELLSGSNPPVGGIHLQDGEK